MVWELTRVPAARLESAEREAESKKSESRAAKNGGRIGHMPPKGNRAEDE